MGRKTLSMSEIEIDFKNRSNGSGSRLRMKWHSVQIWFVVLLSLLTLKEGSCNYIGEGSSIGSLFRGRSFNSPSFLRSRSVVPGSRPSKYAHDELAIVLPQSDRNARNTFSTWDSQSISSIRGGGAALNPFPSGYNPFGYAITSLGKKYLEFEGSLDSDVGRFLSTLKSGQRKTLAVMKEQWLEITRVSKKGQSMRIYRTMDDLIQFCLDSGFID